MTTAAIRHLRMLTRYTAWANARLFDALARLPMLLHGSSRWRPTTGYRFPPKGVLCS